MTRPSTDDLDKELGRLLRAGDPAGDGRDPEQAELQAWRRKILTAEDRPGSPLLRPRLLLPLAATAAAIALAALFFLMPGGQAPTAPAPQLATAQDPVPAITAPEAVASAVPAAPAPSIVTPAAPLAQAMPSPAAAVTSTPTVAVIPAAARTVQFTAPGGTRVIWTLNPDLQLTDHGGKS